MFWLRNVCRSTNLLLFIPKHTKQFIKLRCVCTTNTLNKIEASTLNIFDRNTKSLQRQRAAIADDVNVYDYLKDEIGFRLADRVFDIKRKFKLAADIGKEMN